MPSLTNSPLVNQTSLSPKLLTVHLEDLFFSPSFTDPPITIETWQNWLQTWLDHLDPHLPDAANYELSLRLTTDQEIQSLNAQYRQKNQPTDILAFAALEVDFPQPRLDENDPEPLYLGDLVISVETASRQAENQQHSLTQELAWLGSHGFLHLLGWDHPDEKSLEEMLNQQEILLKSVGFH
jgi:probable rRNA maturation factor